MAKRAEEALDYEGLKLYHQQLKEYIDRKIAEAIEAYRIEDEANDSIIDDQSEEDFSIEE